MPRLGRRTLRLVRRRGAERVRARHDVNRVDEELRGDPRFPLVLAEAEEAEPGNDDDRGIRIAQRRRIRERMRFVVGGVVLTILHQPLGDARLERRERVGRGVKRHVQRRDARAQEMIGTARAHLAERLRPLGVGERDRVLAAVVVRDHAPVRRHRPAQIRQDAVDERRAVRGRLGRRAAEERTARALGVILHELAHLIDGLDAAEIRLFLRLAPREQAVSAEHDAVAPRVRLDRLPQHQRELESGPLPGHPRDAASVLLVELVELLLPVGARGEGDRPVGVKVIDVREREKGVERGVDRRRDAVLAEGAERVITHHLVLVRLAPIPPDEIVQLVHVEHGEPRGANRRQIAAAALDRHHAPRLARQRIGQVELRARVPAAEVRDPEIRAEQVRTIAKELQRLGGEGSRLTGVPEVLEESGFEGRGLRHKSAPGIPKNVDSVRSTRPARQARSARPGTNVR